MQERNEKQEKEIRKQKKKNRIKKGIQTVRMTGHSGRQEKKKREKKGTVHPSQ